MRSNYLKATLKTAVLAVTVLLLGASLAVGQQINLTAGPANLITPDGATIPMWGYTCDDPGTGATCAALNPGAPWSPVVITVPTGSTLNIQLTNNLPAAVTETSLVIVGQLGNDLGHTATSVASPDHSNNQQVTWPIPSPGAANAPPAQGTRVVSFSTPAVHGTPAKLSWSNLKPGTYLIETGTHPSIQGPMGLYGMLVVTTPATAPVDAATPGTAGTAYPSVSYNAEVPILFSEIDPVQNNAVSTAVGTAGFAETNVWSGLVGACGDPNAAVGVKNTCYPPAVNYTPLYYLINGVAFNKNNPVASTFPALPGTSTLPVSGTVLVRMVNAGLRMHVPSIVGSQVTVPPATTAVPGFSLIAEDGNPLPGVPRVQSEVFMAAGKTYDVMVNVPSSAAGALPIFDRELSLSGNATSRDAGMLAYISVNGSGAPAISLPTAAANGDTYNVIPCAAATPQPPCAPLTVSDPSKGVIANDVGVFNVRVTTPPSNGTVTLNADGTFTYVPNPGFSADSFVYTANGNGPSASVTLQQCATGCLEAGSGIAMGDMTFTSTVATHLVINPPGILAADADGDGHPLTVKTDTVAAATNPSGLTLVVQPNGGFEANVPGPGTYTFTYNAKNSQGTVSANTATVTLVFPQPSNLQVTVYDPVTKAPITDYRWVIEEDRTFYVDPNCTTNPPPTGCPGSVKGAVVPTFGTNFHTSYMPVVATGCTGDLSCESGQTVLGQPAVCDIGNGICRKDATEQTAVNPGQVSLDPNKRYYISVLPGDAANPFIAGYTGAPVCTKDASGNIDTSNGNCGHGMGGAPIPALCRPSLGSCATGYQPVTILTQAAPFPPSKLSVFVFEDDFPLNGEQDGGGGIDVLSPNEPGLGGFNITLFDDAGGTGDATGQMTYDMFNMPLSNSLAGTIDPSTQLDACPIGASSFSTSRTATNNLIKQEQSGTTGQGTLGITGTIVTCPKYESDGHTLSPLAGQAVVANLMPGRYGVVATPAADRIARGEEWLQTNTLDGQKAHDSFLRIGEPSFFQEFGPAGYHVSIGFANPSIINSRHKAVCTPNGDPNITGTNCTNSVTAVVTTERMSRTPDERLYSSGDNSSFSFTQCYVSFGDPDGEDFVFTKCDADGKFTLTGLPDGDWRITVFDQWNDMLVDGLSTPVRLAGGKLLDMGQIAMNQWQANIYTKTFFDNNNNGIQDANEDGLALVATNNRFRDGSYSNFNNTDLSGNAGFNEIFPLFSWYVIETDTTRYKSTGVHVVYDAGGPADGTCDSTTAPCGKSEIGANMANTAETVSLPTALRVPGAKYCDVADCDPTKDTFTGGSTGRVDPPFWFGSYGWQGFSGQNSFIEFGKKPYAEATKTAPAENGGIHGEVIYASTRPFDDPGLLIHTSWTPDVPGVTINLYQEGTAPDGSTSLKLIDHTLTSSWDDWAQGFRADGNPNMNCPGQGRDTGTDADLFFFTIYDQPMWLDAYANNGNAAHTLPNNSQFKCFDGMHNWNQVQPAPYDGMYSFPSVTSFDANGRPATTNCTACIPNPDSSDPYRAGTPMLPAGKYVVEMIVPPGYELVKEEDKNILIGDNYIAPVTQQFNALGSVFILPDQAEVSASSSSGCVPDPISGYQCNPQNGTQSLGRTTLPSKEGDTGSVETFWPCVGAARVVPDFISLYPQSGEASPFAGATRNLCDRKEVTLTDQTSALAKFWVFTSAHVAAHFTGVITDDYTSEFDPFSPQFGEKFSPPNMPISLKDWTGTEVTRVYADQWGTYNGLTYSTWEVNPPNPTGYAPTMMVVCMNDPGPIPDGKGGTMIDPLFNPQYSQFCYEIPFMPGQTQYMDTPVVPTSAFAGAGYNNPDCSYPDATPAIKQVVGDVAGPWVDVGTGSVASLSVSSAGNNYTSAPFNFNITGNGGTGAAGHVSDLTLVAIDNFNTNCTASGTNRCSLYALHPAVTITGANGNGSGAVVTATFSSTTHIVSFTVTNGGSGFTGVPTVTIRRGTVFGGSNITVTSTKHMGVDSASLTAVGSGYTGAFSVNINGGGGNTAVAQVVLGTSATQTLTITALGDLVVPNNAYSGPAAAVPPYNAKTITRHYTFGNSAGTVSVGGVTIPSANVNWGDTTITVSLAGVNIPNCTIQQQPQYQGSLARCGQLVITAANGKSSIDAVTVTIGGKKPTVLAAGQTVQDAIDKASPGDMIIVPPGTYNELLLMWKPVRLQGVGAASSILNANTQPAGKMDTWRRRVNCLFGLALNGTPIGGTNRYDPTGTFTCPADQNFAVDRLPLEAAVGWDATLNGNLAELLQEPTLMGALEGAGITVLGKGVIYPAGTSPWNDGTETGGFPVGTQLLQNVPSYIDSTGARVPASTDHCGVTPNPYPSNFECNPSSIDGLSITDSSQGGGGIYVHGWNHNLEIANDRIHSNAGTLSGGINIGQGEHPGQYTYQGTNSAPDTCQPGRTVGAAEPYCFDVDVNIHNNYISQNSSTGDELFSATPAGAGGVSFCNGSDYYRFNYNWVCGNLSSGDGGGIGHIGFSFNGDIEHNVVLFNQSTNPTIPTNGGGILVMGAPDVDPTCGATTDQDCLNPTPVGPSDGTGPNLVINANLVMGNSADSGSGGGIRLQNINGSEVIAFPRTPSVWNTVSITNNIIADNVAGWDGAGISLLDALNTNIINNTVIANDTTGSSGVLFNTLGAPLASSQGPCGVPRNADGTCPQPVTTSTPQPSGLVSIQNSSNLSQNLPGTITCPPNHYSGNSANNGSCRKVSYPELYNNVFWQNRAYYIAVGGLGAGTVNQQNVVSLYNAFTNNQAVSQPQADATTPNGNGVIITGGTGACVSGVNYWDIGVRGDTGPSNHASTVTLAPAYSVLTDAVDYPGLHNLASNPTFISQYCNGSRVPPEFNGMGWQVPPGISDATVPNPIFSLTPAATVDEGNNWVNLSWGPLAEANPVTGNTLGNYGPTSGSSVINLIPSNASTYSAAPSVDFFGNARKTNNAVDAGAVEFIAPPGLNVTPASLSFADQATGTTSAAQTITVQNTGGTDAGSIVVTVSAPFARPNGNAGGTCGAVLTAGNSCTIAVVFSPTITGPANGSVTISANVPVTGSPVSLTGTGVTSVGSATLTPASHDYGTRTRTCPGTTIGQIVACTLEPTQAFTLRNTGTTTLTGIGKGALGGTDAAEFTIVNAASTCGPAGGGQIVGNTTLAPNATCVVTVQVKPQTSLPTGAKSATVSVTDSAGTQTSAVTFTAN
jgi:hypothetical protein